MWLACDSHMSLVKLNYVIFFFALLCYLLFFLPFSLVFYVSLYFMLSVMKHLCQHLHSLLVIVYKVVNMHCIMIYILYILFFLTLHVMLIETM